MAQIGRKRFGAKPESDGFSLICGLRLGQ